MLKYIIISNSNHYGWNCAYITPSKAIKLLKQEDIVVYIFKIEYKNKKDIVKLNYPFNQYYSCLEINDINILNNIIKNEDVYDVNEVEYVNEDDKDDEDNEHVEIYLLKDPILKFVN